MSLELHVSIHKHVQTLGMPSEMAEDILQIHAQLSQIYICN